MGSSHNGTLHQLFSPNILRVINQEERDGRKIWHIWGGVMCTQDYDEEIDIKEVIRQNYAQWKVQLNAS
jgi:hypothetical protein